MFKRIQFCNYCKNTLHVARKRSQKYYKNTSFKLFVIISAKMVLGRWKTILLNIDWVICKLVERLLPPSLFEFRGNPGIRALYQAIGTPILSKAIPRKAPSGQGKLRNFAQVCGWRLMWGSYLLAPSSPALCYMLRWAEQNTLTEVVVAQEEVAFGTPISSDTQILRIKFMWGRFFLSSFPRHEAHKLSFSGPKLFFLGVGGKQSTVYHHCQYHHRHETLSFKLFRFLQLQLARLLEITVVVFLVLWMHNSCRKQSIMGMLKSFLQWQWQDLAPFEFKCTEFEENGILSKFTPQ